MATAQDRVLVWQMSRNCKIGVLLAHAVFPLFCLFALVLEPTLPLVITTLAVTGIAAFSATMVRRRCVLEDDRLVMRGRFAVRTVELRDLRQAALTLSQFCWVQTHRPVGRGGATVFRLPAVPAVRTVDGRMIAKDAVTVIRKRAKAAGAAVEPMPTRGTRSPLQRQGLFFGR